MDLNQSTFLQLSSGQEGCHPEEGGAKSSRLMHQSTIGTLSQKRQTAKRTWEGIGEKRHAAMAKPRMSPGKCTPKMSQRSSNKVEDPKPACQAEGSGTSEKKFAKGDASTSGDFFLWLVSSFHWRTIRAVSPLQELSCRCHGLSQNVPSPVPSVPYDRLPNRKHNLPPARFVSIRSSNASQLISNDRTHHHQGNLV